jgi:tetratricopeptide (TPR) repeat protein
MSKQTDHKKSARRNPTLTPPDASSSSEAPTSRAPYLVAAIGVVLALLALLVVFLPFNSEVKPTLTEVKPVARQQASPAVVTPRQEDSRAAAEVDALLEAWLQQQAAAEAENVAVWGGERYAGAVSQARECDRLLKEFEYRSAAQACHAATTQLEDLMAQQQELLAAEIRAGEHALGQGDAETAAAHFQRALAIDEANPQARNGAQRAVELPRVLQLIVEGTQLESDRDLEGAALAFGEAIKLDPDFKPASAGLARVEERIAEQRFQQVMSLALQAFAEGRLASAEKALQQAKSIRPADPAVSDLEQQLSRSKLSARLARLRDEAAAHQAAERWDEALNACEEALTLEPDAAFATACTTRATARIELDKRLGGFLSHPEKLFEDAPLDEARQLLAYASSVQPQGPKLAVQIERLSVLVLEAEVEVEVVIISDELTEVTIYHVGRLGRFFEKKLVLRTGDYIATGSRNGYRDVRQTLKVRPGSGPQYFTLLCEEPI